MPITYSSESNFTERFIDQGAFALTGNSDSRGGKNCEPNLVEKAGNGILFIVGSIPRSANWIGKQFQDPRVLTVVFTALALIATSFIFYPITSALTTKTVAVFIGKQLAQIPLWTVRLAAYILTCTTIVGYGARAGGRFGNNELMKEFYGLPNYQGNPCKLSNGEIKMLRKEPLNLSQSR